MDDRDEAILRVLLEKGDASTREISDHTSIPVSTVHKRKQELEEKGIVRRYTVDVDWEQVGFDFDGWVLMKVNLPQLRRQGLEQSDLLNELVGLDGVSDATVVTGEYDILISVRAEDKQSFSDILQSKVQSLTGVQDTTTMISLD